MATALERRSCTHNFLDEIKLVLGVTTEEEVWMFFFYQCFDFWSAKDTADLGDIGDGTDVFLKSFFDGGTYWNEARETTNINGEVVNVLSEDPGGKIDAVDTGVSRNGIIGLPDQLSNFDGCAIRSVMCCWVQDRQAGDDNGNCAEPYDDECVDADPNRNTDLCAVNMGRAPESARVGAGVTLFPRGSERATHCHGFAWDDNQVAASNIFKGNMLFHVSMFDHLYTRGYVKNVPGAPMCACAEQMPAVSRADCTETGVLQDTTFSFAPSLTVRISNDFEVVFRACRNPNGPNNDLESYYTHLVAEDRAAPEELAVLKETVVGRGNCPVVVDFILDYLGGR